VLLAAAGNITHVASAIQTDAIAVFKSIQQAVQLGMQHIILEMDASVLARAIKASGVDRSPITCLVNQIRDIKRLEFSSCIISVCNRACNKVVDGLATYGASVLMSGSNVTMTEVSVFVSELVSGDLPSNGM
jgi:hypothetical protein